MEIEEVICFDVASGPSLPKVCPPSWLEVCLGEHCCTIYNQGLIELSWMLLKIDLDTIHESVVNDLSAYSFQDLMKIRSCDGPAR